MCVKLAELQRMSGDKGIFLPIIPRLKEVLGPNPFSIGHRPDTLTHGSSTAKRVAELFRDRWTKVVM